MSRHRCEISAAEVGELHERLDRQLDRVGLETQPQVAVRLLELVQNPEAALREYTEVVKADWTLTGRLLKLANSAFYAQRSPVTKLDRALVLLGLERTKAISLGFYLTRAASAPDEREISRSVWGESVYRAGLCASLAKVVCPALAAEAFIVGLMLDCGQPLMAKLIGPAYAELRREHRSPAKLYTVEFNTLEFTHVDIAAVLMKRWKLPQVLSRPIGWHHTMPSAGRTTDPAVLLQRVAYYTGAVQVTPDGTPAQEIPLESIAGRLFELDAEGVSSVVQRAGSEYRATIDLFADIAERCKNVDALADAVQHQMITLMDEQLSREVLLESRGGADHVIISGQRVELEPGREGEVVAILTGQGGDRIISCTLKPATDGPEKLCSRLGLEQAKPDEIEALMRAVRAMAA
jgi:HD-like signal output (HDOD) protein